MKKAIFICFMLLAYCAGYSQSIQKGNLVGMHVIMLKLNPDFTKEQAIDFFMQKYIPAAEQNFPGMKIFLVKGIRGENENQIGQIAVFESETVRDKYYNDDGSFTETGMAASKKVSSVLEEFNKMGSYTSVYTDWVVQ